MLLLLILKFARKNKNKKVPQFWLNLSKLLFKMINTDQDGIWSEPPSGNFSAVWPWDTCWQGLHRQNLQATILYHEALLLFSKNYNSQNLRKLHGPWAGGAYRLTLGLTLWVCCSYFERSENSAQGTPPNLTQRLNVLGQARAHSKPSPNFPRDGTKFSLSPTSSCLPVFLSAKLHCQFNRI